jgi:uncharacterized membrane protein
MEQTSKQPVKSISSDKPYDLDPNVEAALSYLITPITGIVVFMLEKNNKFVRFHAMQSTMFGVAVFILWNISIALIPVLIGGILAPLLAIGFFILWLLLMWKAYNKEEWELPIIGKIAHDQVNK